VAGGLAAVVLILAVLVATKKPSTPLWPRTVAATDARHRNVPRRHKPTPPPGDPRRSARSDEGRHRAGTTAPYHRRPAARSGAAKPRSRRGRRADAKVLSPAPTQVPQAAPPADTRPIRRSRRRVKAEGTKALEPAGIRRRRVIQATVFLNISPWGEVFVNGKSQGVSPPKKFVKLDPGKYKIEVRNTTFPCTRRTSK
jgi:hypothetical protein